jgi:hypothetical protein
MGIKAHAFLRIGIISPGNFRPLLQFAESAFGVGQRAGSYPATLLQEAPNKGGNAVKESPITVGL